jgi:indole-3-glycerol phosphate synthase/phosphoribosylanthranilate isomerase
VAESILAEIVRRKRSDVIERLRGFTLDPAPTPRSLLSALSRPGARFIMELKRNSPSGHRSDVGVAEAVSAYAPVADAISVLTDEPYFSGSLADLRATRARFGGPILAKDFIIDPRQVTEARMHGADAVLAICSLLDDREISAMMSEAQRLNMDVILEIHDRTELLRAVALGARIVGINNRDLKTLKTDLSVTEHLASLVSEDVILVSESGICARTDVERLAPNVDAFLVGSSLMASEDIALSARSLVHGPVKICGLTSVKDVKNASRAGATHVGFIFADASPRKLDRNAATVLVEARGTGVKAVGVFRDQSNAVVAATANKLSLDAVQLHGGIEQLQQLRASLPKDCEIWAACGVAEVAETARAECDRTLFDTTVGGRSGGTGQPFDWKLIAGRVDLPKAFLAGGIGPANARAAQQVGAYGIDVGSAVEADPGRKDPDKLEALFDVLRPQCRGTAKCG